MVCHRIYGKLKADKRFKAFNYNAGNFVGNLIHAAFYDEEELPMVEEAVKHLNEDNPEYEFVIRKV